MTATPSHGHRRHRRSTPFQRVARAAGLGNSRPKAAVLVGAVLVAVVAWIVASGGSVPPESGAIGSSSSPAIVLGVSPTASPSATMSALPAIVSPSPGATPSSSAPTTEIVARRIRIPRLGIDLRIVEGDGLDAPMYKAAHYPGSSWPGGGSNIYIYAHAQTGMFLPLWGIKVGDQVDLTLVDGTHRLYAVVTIKPKVPWDALQYLAPTPTEQLTLQTSTSYTPTSPRFVAIAKPEPAP